VVRSLGKKRKTGAERVKKKTIEEKVKRFNRK
jgi:hypothetical protein